MTPSVRLALILLLLAVQQYAAVSAVSGSVDEFQCACGYNAARHLRVVRDTLQAGSGLTAAAGLASGYGLLVSRMLFVASNRPEPTARWLWLFDLYANGASQQLVKIGRRQRRARWFALAVNYVGQELDRYLAICKSRGVGDGGSPWRDQKSFEKYVLENVTAIEQRPTVGFGSVKDFAPRWLYLNYVADDDDALRTRGVMPPSVGIDWQSTADQLSSLYRNAVNKWVFGTQELVLYQKKFIATVVATLMGHVLVHVEHCRTHRLLATAQPDETAVTHTDTTVTPDTAIAAADVGEGHILNAGDGVPVGEYELMWMSVGTLLDKYKSYLALDQEKYYRTLVEVAANPARDDRGFRLTRRVIETHMAELGVGMFGLAATNWTAVADEAAAENPQTLIELIALVDNNISAAERYLKNVRELLSDVDFKIVKKFMRSTHIWLL